MTPRLEGLQHDLPPNRARRAVELVAYLALHQPDVVTSDRLRTRVLGSSDADAAAKTLFNTAYAARRALGVDEDGAPLFPAGTRQRPLPTLTPGHRRCAARRRAGRAGQGTDGPGCAIAFLPGRVELVEGEPMANALSGYAWWEARGPRRARRRRAGRRRLHHGRAGLRRRTVRPRPLGARAGAAGRALQRVALPGRHAGGCGRRRRRSPPPRVARVPAPGRRARPGQLTVAPHGVASTASWPVDVLVGAAPSRTRDGTPMARP